jgi:hypothetical protein
MIDEENVATYAVSIYEYYFLINVIMMLYLSERCFSI